MQANGAAIDVTGAPLPVWLVVDALAVYALARTLTRDYFPPSAWLRAKKVSGPEDRL